MLPNDICRCLGSMCTRKHECLRYLAPCGDWTPIQERVCGKDFDAFIPVTKEASK